MSQRFQTALALLLAAPLWAGDRGVESARVQPPAPPAPLTAAAPRAQARTLAALMELVGRKAVEVAGGRKIRLAVIPLKGTESARYGDKGFGAFLTERVSSAMVGADSPVRLFERTRLDAVLKEQTLSASGIFDESEARRIGELAPIDYILTGTFTRLDQTVAVNLRFIDVVSGEVRGNLSENLELTTDLAALFEDLQARATPQAPTTRVEPAPCEGSWAPVRKLMEDIGTPAKQNALVEAAMAIPFELPCGKIHFEVIDLLARYKQYPPRYDAFLLKVLQGIENPDADDRDGAIIQYLLTRGQLDDEAWAATLRAASLSKQFRLYPAWLLADRHGTAASKRKVHQRIGLLMDQVAQRKVGRPVPVETGMAFMDVLATLRRTYLGSDAGTKDVRPLMEAYQAYAPKYAKEPDKRMLELLHGMFLSAGPGPDKDRILGWWCERVNAFPPSRDLQDEVVDFLRPLFEGTKAGPRKDPEAPRILKRIAALSGKRIAETVPHIIGRDYRLDVTGFCLENGIKAPGLIPDVNALVADLSGDDDTARMEAIRLLKHLGPGAAPAEPVALKWLRRTSGQGTWDGRYKYLQHDLLGLLGSLQTRTPEAHALLIHYLKDIESYVADEAVLALSRIGDPAAGALKEAFPTIEEAYKQIRVIKVFHLRGKAAQPHLPWLNAVLQNTPSPYVRDAAEDAIEAISKP